MLASTFRSKIPVHALNIIFFFQLHNKYMTQQSTQEQEKREYIARQEHQKLRSHVDDGPDDAVAVFRLHACYSPAAPHTCRRCPRRQRRLAHTG